MVVHHFLPRFPPLALPETPSSGGSSFFLEHVLLEGPPVKFISLRPEDVKSMGNITSQLNRFINKGEILGLHSCNGLLCIDIIFNLSYHNEFRRLFVYNPTTNEYDTISWEKSNQDQCEGLNIVFDSFKSDYYTLVSLVTNEDEDELRVVVYSSETRVWSETGDTFAYDDRYYFEKGAYWNGDLHWVSASSGCLCFDLENQCLRPVIPHPPAPAPAFQWPGICFFGESGGHLYFIGLNKPPAMLFQVFSLKRDYSCWEVKYSIDVAPLVTLYPSMVVKESGEEHFDLHIPCFVVEEKEKKTMPVIFHKDKVISYDINDMTIKEIAKVNLRYLQERSFSFKVSSYMLVAAVQHIETFACILYSISFWILVSIAI